LSPLSFELPLPGKTVVLLAFAAAFAVFASAAAGHSISVRNHGLAAEIDGQSGGIQRLENQGKGSEYAGRQYRSLSEIARKITGTRWSGPAFFGLKQLPNKRPNS